MKKPLIIILLLIIFILIGSSTWYLSRLKSRPTTPSGQSPLGGATPAVSQTIQILPVLTRSAQGTTLDLWWQPGSGTVPLSTVGLEMTLKNPQGQVKALTANPTWGETYQTPTWHVAFDNLVNNPDGTVTFKVSAVNVAPEPLNLSQKTLLLSIPLNLPQGKTVILTLNPSVSQAFDKKNTLITLALSPVTTTNK